MCVVDMQQRVYSVGSDDTWVSSNLGVTFTNVTLTSGRWSPRTWFAGGIYTIGSTDYITVLGGRDAPNAARPYGGEDHNDVWQSTTGGQSWTQLTAAAAWGVRDQHSFAVSTATGSLVMVMYGGDRYDGYGSYYTDMWSSTGQRASPHTARLLLVSPSPANTDTDPRATCPVRRRCDLDAPQADHVHRQLQRMRKSTNSPRICTPSCPSFPSTVAR